MRKSAARLTKAATRRVAREMKTVMRKREQTAAEDEQVNRPARPFLEKGVVNERVHRLDVQFGAGHEPEGRRVFVVDPVSGGADEHHLVAQQGAAAEISLPIAGQENLVNRDRDVGARRPAEPEKMLRERVRQAGIREPARAAGREGGRSIGGDGGLGRQFDSAVFGLEDFHGGAVARAANDAVEAGPEVDVADRGILRADVGHHRFARGIEDRRFLTGAHDVGGEVRPDDDLARVTRDRGFEHIIAHAGLRQEDIEQHTARARGEQPFGDQGVDFARPGPAAGDQIQRVTFGTRRRNVGVERLQIELRKTNRAAVDPEEDEPRVRRQETAGSGDRVAEAVFPARQGAACQALFLEPKKAGHGRGQEQTNEAVNDRPRETQFHRAVLSKRDATWAGLSCLTLFFIGGEMPGIIYENVK